MKYVAVVVLVLLMPSVFCWDEKGKKKEKKLKGGVMVLLSSRYSYGSIANIA